MVPDWNVSGVLPPIRPDGPGNTPDRSPYRIGIPHIVERYATSIERIAILKGLLEYRQELHALGIIQGFQWLDGSFMEQVELIESRPPRDVDVVSFLYLPAGVDQATLVAENEDLFYPDRAKQRYRVDGYIYPLGLPLEGYNVREIAYWYSMWSHRRDGLWKGFVQVDLSPSEDAAASAALELIQCEGGQP